jgi:hypothetical protein
MSSEERSDTTCIQHQQQQRHRAYNLIFVNVAKEFQARSHHLIQVWRMTLSYFLVYFLTRSVHVVQSYRSQLDGEGRGSIPVDYLDY